jgi:hypothetical protein
LSDTKRPSGCPLSVENYGGDCFFAKDHGFTVMNRAPSITNAKISAHLLIIPVLQQKGFPLLLSIWHLEIWSIPVTLFGAFVKLNSPFREIKEPEEGR